MMGQLLNITSLTSEQYASAEIFLDEVISTQCKLIVAAITVDCIELMEAGNNRGWSAISHENNNRFFKLVPHSFEIACKPTTVDYIGTVTSPVTLTAPPKEVYCATPW